MTETNTCIAITNYTVEKMSRHEMLEWVNSTVHGQYKKIEELCSGVAYCQMMELLFPNSVGLKKIKMAAKLEHEYLHNLKLFQSAFTRIKYDKSVPIDRLIKGRFQDNFEFLQWFKKFFDTQSGGKENLKTPAALAAAHANAPKPIRKPGGTATLPLPDMDNLHHQKQEQQKLPISPTNLNILQETHEKLIEQVKGIEHERNYYFEKLTSIEKLLNQSVEKNEYVEWCKRALEILYAVDDIGDVAIGDDNSIE